jgi:uncharacterized protein (DUF433 family)
MNAGDMPISLIGAGVYTPGDAARLTDIPTARIRRWLSGRNRNYLGENIFDEPLWHSQIPEIDGSLFLGFRDLIELRLVDGFRKQGISMPYLRKVVEAARALVGDTHPFSTTKFKTDGKRLYLEILEITGEPQLIEVLSGQHAFHSIVSKGLQDIEFEAGVAALWRPRDGDGEVVIDPARSFGQPILDRFGTPTAAIFLAHGAGRTTREIADAFEMDETAVRAAVRFETRLAA